MYSVLLMILALTPVVSVDSGSSAAAVDLTEMLSMGRPLGTVSCEPGIPQAICSLEEGGFAVVTERPARLIFIDGAGNRSAEDFELPELFPRPRCLLSLSRGHLVIVDRGGALGEIDRRGRLVRKLPGLKTRWQPGALSLSPGGTGLLISDVYRGEVHRLDFDGNLQQSWTGFIDPRGIAVVGDKIWVSDRGYHRLFSIDLNQDSPAIEEGVGDHGAAPGLLAGPMGICGFDQRVLLVADRDNHRIQVFGSHGISMHHWGVHAMVPREASGRLHYPEALALDEASMICAVLEPSERRIQRFGVRDPELPVEAAEQWSRVDLVSHYGQHWAVESEGRLLAVSEPDSERVSVMARDPQIPFVLDEVGGNGALATQFRSPSGLDFMPARPFPRLVVADQGNHRLQMFEIRRNKSAVLRREPWLMALVRAVDLSLLCEQTTGWQALLPPRPGAVACMEDGTIAVSDTANRRVLLLDDKFRPKGILVARRAHRHAAHAGGRLLVMEIQEPGRLRRHSTRHGLYGPQTREFWWGGVP
ncbi:MAG: NHL repeat-containing protein, partial [Planctomycetota bacterium]